MNRIQRGETVRIGLVLDRHPDSLPIVTLVGPDDATVDGFPRPIPFIGAALSMIGPDRASFALDYAPGPGAILGSYRAMLHYVIDGVADEAEERFELVAGGDSGGQVIALYHYDRPEASYVLAQLSSGRLVQGKNPHL